MSYILNPATPPPLTLYLDSRFGTLIEEDSDGNKLTTNYLYNLNEPIVVPNNMNVLLQLNTATIPYSFYNVRTGINDVIFVLKTISGITSTSTITLDNGNYTANSLATEIKSKIESDLGGFSLNFTASYQRRLQKYRFSFTANVILEKITLSAGTEREAALIGERNADNLIGLRDGTNIEINRDTGAGENAFSNMVVDINDNIHGLYIRQNLSTKQTLDNSTGTFSNILERIPISTNAGGVIFYANENSHKTMIDTNLIQTLGIRLTDDKHRSIDLNGLNFQISLVLSFIYKEPIRVERNRFERRIMENIKIGENKITLNNNRKLKIKENTKKEKK